MIKKYVVTIALGLLTYSANSCADWEVYDDFNDGVFDAIKWRSIFGDADYESPFSEGNGTLKNFIPTGILNQGPGTSFDFPGLSSSFIEGLKGVRVKLFISDTCAEDGVVSYLNVSVSAQGVKHKSVTASSLIRISIDNNELDQISEISVRSGTFKDKFFNADIDITSDPSRYTGKWIKITQYFSNPKNLRFWTNLDGAESQIKYTNKSFEAKWGSQFRIHFSGQYVDPYPSNLCRIWIDNVDVLK